MACYKATPEYTYLYTPAGIPATRLHTYGADTRYPSARPGPDKGAGIECHLLGFWPPSTARDIGVIANLSGAPAFPSPRSPANTPAMMAYLVRAAMRRALRAFRLRHGRRSRDRRGRGDGRARAQPDAACRHDAEA